jgi:hypothetical protein
MAGDDAKARLLAASQAVSTAVMVLQMEKPTMEAFLKEARDMDNFGYIVNPTLANDSERRAVSAMLEPLFKAALDFLTAYDTQLARSKDALAKVQPTP